MSEQQDIFFCIRGIDMGSKEYFVRCFLRKEWMPRLKKKFLLEQIGSAQAGSEVHIDRNE